jgi:hypothetical protein
MTRRDYVSIAESLSKAAGALGQEKLYIVADAIATDLKEQNQAFGYDLFLENAGVTQETIERSKE